MDDFDAQAQAFCEHIEKELDGRQLGFPTAFDVSLRIKRLADNPATTLDEIGAVVRAEPLLAAKVVRMANSVRFGPYGTPAENVHDAIGRIGLSVLRCLAFAVAAEQLAKDHRSKHLRLIASGLWMHSVDVAAWSYALARRLGIGNPDTAMFAGILIDIGQFFLVARAADYPALESDLDRFAEIASIWNEPVGRAILEAFELPDAVLDAFPYEDPYGGSWPPANLADLVFVASLAAETPNPFAAQLGMRTHADVLASSIPDFDAAALAELLDHARAERQQVLAAVCG